MSSGINLRTTPRPGEASQYGALLADGGCCSLPTRGGTSSVMGTSGTMYVSYFRVPAAMLAASAVVGNGVAAVATPTVCRIGLYRVAANGNLTLIGSTANDTALFGTAYTSYSKALTVPVAVVAGEWLATGVLVVSAAAMPDVVGAYAAGPTFLATETAPKLAASIGGLADLPASVLAAAALASSVAPWVEVHP